MDFILLVITQGFLKTSTTHTYVRTAIAASIGGIWACVVETGIIKNVFIRDIFTYIFVCAAMSIICLGYRKPRKVIKAAFVLTVLASSIGGAAGLLYWHTGVGFWFRTMALYSTGMFICMLAAMIAFTIVLRQFWLQKTYSGKIHDIKIDFGGFVLEIKGLGDTGNVLYDPFCKKPVHVIDKSCLMKAGFNAFAAELKLHYIPFGSVGCKNGCMPVIMAKKLQISSAGSENYICLEDIPIGISETVLSSDGMYQMLINSEVLR